VTERSTESLLRELPRRLEPVRPIPPLRTVGLALLAIFAAVVALHRLLGGALPLLAGGIPWSDPPFLGVLVGLVLTGVEAVVAALAGAVPGRQAAARAGRAAVLLGAVLASSAALWATLRADLSAAPLPIASSLHCLGRAGALGLVPAFFLCLFLARALERRPLLGAGFACVGAITLGAVVVHTTCPHGGAIHVLLGHWLSPFALALLLALPMGALVRGLSQRR
jgi:hypothetical protein